LFSDASVSVAVSTLLNGDPTGKQINKTNKKLEKQLVSAVLYIP
jgi:hypothetical protein